jgi:hypothetical protein
MTIAPTTLGAALLLVTAAALAIYRFGRASQRQSDAGAIDAEKQRTWEAEERAAKATGDREVALVAARRSHELAEAWERRAMENEGALRLRDGDLVGWN